MKRDFLQNLMVGDTPLPKEVVDAIMEENGKDIQAAKAAAIKPYADYDQICGDYRRLQEQSLAEGKTAVQWKQAYDQAAQEYETHLAGITFQHRLDQAITASGGRNAKAIMALLDMEALQKQEDPQKAITDALEKLKQEDGYLFGSPPPYAQFTGTQTKERTPTDLAGALRQKFERK